MLYFFMVKTYSFSRTINWFNASKASQPYISAGPPPISTEKPMVSTNAKLLHCITEYHDIQQELEKT